MNILIVGGGKLVYFLSRSFVSKGHKVTIINRDQVECERLARRLKAVVVCGDGTDPRLLSEAGAEEIDVIVAVTHRDEDNLAVAQAAQYGFGVRRTLALVNDPENEEVFRQLGVTSALSLTQIISYLIERRIEAANIINIIPVFEGKINLTEVVLSAECPAAGQTLQSLDMPAGSLVSCVLRDDQAIIPRGSTRLESGDRLVVMTLPENHGPALAVLMGAKR
jgi:trk system potassium uptake protein TrkA